MTLATATTHSPLRHVDHAVVHNQAAMVGKHLGVLRNNYLAVLERSLITWHIFPIPLFESITC